MSSKTNQTRTGSFVGAGVDKKVVLGFKPKAIKIYNTTDGIDYKKTETMADDKARKEIIDGTKTFVDAVTINADGFTLIAAEAVDTKTYHYEATESNSEF